MAIATVTSNDEMMMTMPHAALIIGGFTAAIADATSKATKASGVLRVQRLCVGWRSWGLPGCPEGANYKFKIESGMKMRI